MANSRFEMARVSKWPGTSVLTKPINNSSMKIELKCGKDVYVNLLQVDAMS